MFSDLHLLWKIQTAPLFAFVVIFLLPKRAQKIAPAIGMLCAASAAVASLMLFNRYQGGAGLPVEFSHKWLFVSDRPLWAFVDIKDYTLPVGFLLDKLNILMITLVTTISFFVQVFSYYYMATDESRPRYFAFLSFFSFAMTGLVLSSNLLQTFLFWELVGLASYLLIGFWYEKTSAATAARKAFVINRLADLGFYLGILCLFMLVGTVRFQDLTADMLRQALPATTVTILGILVLTGVMGKSAQFPFHVWLPDAMEGPTPVSALIHSATMVAAGVFLLVRCFGLFSASETTLHVTLIVGTLTALIGACMGTIQRDIKRIMAYSTVSQLGFMVMAIGAGSTVAGMFHLSTHAYFKSLLFLTSGAFIHRFHTNDIFEIGKKGGKKETLSMAVLIVGLFSLCGIFPFAGFFSKDMILETLHHHGMLFYGASLVVTFLTAYYSFRLLFVLLFSKEEHHGHHDKHEAHHDSAILTFCKALPLISLAAISLYVGYLGTQWGDGKILHWLGGEVEPINTEILFTTIGLIAAAAGIAFVQFRDPAKALVNLETRPNPVKTLLENKFYIDDAYAFVVKKIGLGLAKILNWFDKTVVNELMVNQSAYSIMRLGRVLSKVQTGMLQDYLSLALGAAVLVVFYLIHSVRG